MKSIIFSACLILFVTGIFGQNQSDYKTCFKNVGIVNKDMSSALQFWNQENIQSEQ
ncbi:MAG: hypothetical protein IPN82_12420 [Chitinophagaceae bacterium]|nr:hypothetical protein [Chitinophagaceae bacterium]